MSSIPFADALTPFLVRLRTRYTQSPLPAFLNWWWGELRACLPQRLQALLTGQEAEIQLVAHADGVKVLRRGADGAVELATFSAEQLDDSGLDLSALLGESEQRLPRVALLAERQVLLRRLSLPVAAAANVRTMVGYEIDRQTPFRADQVEFDCKLGKLAPGAKMVEVELAVVPREQLQSMLRSIGAQSLTLDAIDVQRNEHRIGFNLLPEGKRRVRDPRPMLINILLVSTAVILLLLSMAQVVENRRQAVQAIEADVETQREYARSAGKLRSSLESAAEGANFLAEQRRQRPSVVELLRLLTDTLPDDTFVERMAFSNDVLSVTVQSGSAAKLVELLQKTPMLRNAALAGAIQPDPRSGKDRATLTAEYAPHGDQP
ncbi:PilN domain-containing protein [Pseudomarimonas arenosa]|uniref:General secretion pathway protein GspL n=1 Tax=Pseudomarimonas arenosa TaxID=2774145 RepID=A0AAW3ZL39_9GAMM|nr:PilN domain-containing protein [Pseudomarimonas arenosa]MBD8526448.1 hypothetical protein [Pseudomarimonas arenosa]